MLCFTIVPGDSPMTTIFQTGLAALGVSGAIALTEPRRLLPGDIRRVGGDRETRIIAGSLIVIAVGYGALSSWGILYLGTGDSRGGEILQPGTLPAEAVFGSYGFIWFSRIAGMVVLCLCTGLFEEVLFRGIIFHDFANALRLTASSAPMMKAAVASSALFGLLHLSGTDVFTAWSSPASFDPLIVAHSIAKPVQAGMFGFIMASLYERTRNLWLVIGVHASYNVLSEGPTMLLTGSLPQGYATGNPYDLAVLILSIVLVAPLVIRSFTKFVCDEPLRA